jgi:hypothetical protein
VAASKPTGKTTEIKKRTRLALDEVKRGEVCAILAVGGSRQLAAQYVGCSATTIRNTALRDASFKEQLEKAESQHEIGYLQNIRAAARKEQYWRAAAWVLERRFPDRYGPRKPGTTSVEQIMQLLGQFAEMIVQEVPTPEAQQRILARLQVLAGSDSAEDAEDSTA